MVRGARSVFTREFLHRRTAATAVAATAVAARPIFIVGLPRSGSTLVEQILASHPSVEGLGELFDMERLLLEFTAGSGARNWLEDRTSTRRTPVTNAHLVCRLLLEKN